MNAPNDIDRTDTIGLSFLNADEQEDKEKQRLLLERMTTTSPDLIYVYDLTEQRNIYCNGRISTILGYTPEEIIAMGDALNEIVVHPDDFPILKDNVGHLLSLKDDEIRENSFRTRHRDGSNRWILALETPFTRNPDGSVRQFLGVARDITQKRVEEERLRLAETMVANAKDAIMITEAEPFDLPGPRIQFVNPAFTEMTGYSPEEIMGKTPRILQGEGSDRKTLDQIRHCLENWEDFQVEILNYRKDGTAFWSEISARPITNSDGRYTHWIAIQRDVTARKVIEEERTRLLTEARERANRDHLTGLFNRHAFYQRVSELGKNPHRSVTVILMDIANFKFFNDVYGYAGGDTVLVQVADILRETIGQNEGFLARLGGDEFVVLLDGCGVRETINLMKRIESAIDGVGYQPNDSEYIIPFKLWSGFALVPEDAADPIAALRIADERLRAHKLGEERDATVEAMRLQLAGSIKGFSMLDALVNAVDNKDRYTRQHSEDVTRYTIEIVTRLGWSEAEKTTITAAALLHDVGKIGVSDRILRLPGKLTPEEQCAIRLHPSLGAMLVATVEGLEGTVDVVRYHHERWDGNGYPEGLTGKAIPLPARIVAVADAFSAMTTNRPYRRRHNVAEAIMILRAGSGIQWDAMCVDAFVEAITEK